MVWGSVTTFMSWFPCFPVKAFWDWSIKNKKCYAYGSIYVIDHYATFLSHSVVNMVMDGIILALPFPMLFNAKTTYRTKLGVTGLLVLGIWYVFVSCQILIFYITNHSIKVPMSSLRYVLQKPSNTKPCPIPPSITPGTLHLSVFWVCWKSTSPVSALRFQFSGP